MSEKNNKKNKYNFYIQRIYSKDISFEVPHAPKIFKKEWKPELKININNNSVKLTKEDYEVILCVTVTVSIDKEVAFLCEVKQAGIFSLYGIENDDTDHCLGIYCPNILFPYARECITNLVSRGTFPQLNLAPVNFKELFIQYRKNNR